MVHYFYGQDTYAARGAISALADENGARLHWLEAPDLAERGAAGLVASGSMGLFGRELFVARDVSGWSKGLQDDLLASLARAGRSIDCVVWDRGVTDRRSALYRQLARPAAKPGERASTAGPDGLRLAGQAREFSLPSPTEAAQWIADEAVRRGGKIDRSAARLLVDLAGVDRWQLTAELDKLLLSDEAITVAAVRREVPPSGSAEIFSTLDALSRGRRQQAVSSVMTLLQNGESEFYILSMLAYQFRTLHAIRRGLEQGHGQGEIARAAGLAPYAVQKNYPHAQRFSLAVLREALARILATDFAIRRGVVDQRTAVLLLVLSLAR
jgi:DNA polymerase III delta subunit